MKIYFIVRKKYSYVSSRGQKINLEGHSYILKLVNRQFLNIIIELFLNNIVNENIYKKKINIRKSDL